MSVLELEPMARPKSNPQPAPESEKAPKERASQEIIVTYKADRSVSAEFKEWLDGLADDVGAPVTVTIDMALKAFAAARGYRPMPRRLVR